MSTDTAVLVIGAGPAGITAATTAAMHGQQVLLLDDNPAPGGPIGASRLQRSRKIRTTQSERRCWRCASRSPRLLRLARLRRTATTNPARYM